MIESAQYDILGTDSHLIGRIHRPFVPPTTHAAGCV